jgi:rRNA-processing protein FCF1
VPLKVIFDSNFLFIPAKFQIDIFEELPRLVNQRVEPVLLSSIYQEIQAMTEKGAPSRRKQASLALKLAEKCRRIYVERSIEESNDDIILRIATIWKNPVATNDKELRRRLRARNIPVIYLRSENRLELEGAL